MLSFLFDVRIKKPLFYQKMFILSSLIRVIDFKKDVATWKELIVKFKIFFLKVVSCDRL